MRKIILLVTIPLIILASSCKEDKENIQMKEVMAIHDKVMPKMSQLGSLVGELNDKEKDSTDLRIQYEQARKDLQDANKSMMDWMQNFGNRFDHDEILNGKELSEQKKQWLDEEEEKVKALQEEINSSIENAKKLLNKKE